MSETLAYKPTGKHSETFSYLPPMTPDRLRKQISYLINQGWSPAIEYTEPEKAFSSFWYLWKLPFFGERSVDKILAELEACHRANPGHARPATRLRQLQPEPRHSLRRLSRRRALKGRAVDTIDSQSGRAAAMARRLALSAGKAALPPLRSSASGMVSVVQARPRRQAPHAPIQARRHQQCLPPLRRAWRPRADRPRRIAGAPTFAVGRQGCGRRHAATPNAADAGTIGGCIGP